MLLVRTVSLLFIEPYLVSLLLYRTLSCLCYSRNRVLSGLSAILRTLSCLSGTPRTLSFLSANPRTSSPGCFPELCPVSLLLSRTSSWPSATPRTLFCLVSLLLLGPDLSLCYSQDLVLSLCYSQNLVLSRLCYS